METAAADADAQFRDGAGCLVAWLEGRIVYHLWVSDTGAYIPWIFRRVDPPAGHVLVFDVWVHPDHRGGNLHWAGAAEACDEAVRRGRPAVFAGVEPDEFPPFAAKYAKLGLVVIEPCYSLVGVQAFLRPLHWRRSAEPRLRRISQDLAARHAGLWREPPAGPAETP